MNEVLVIRILGLLRPIYISAGIDYNQMISIIKLKLLMDKRRINLSVSADDESEKAEQKNYFLRNMIFYTISGIFSGATLYLQGPMFFKMTIFLSMQIVLLMSLMVSDYSAVMLDVKEKDIIASRPVEEKTLNAARMTHIVLYIGAYALALSAAGFVAGTLLLGPMYFLMLLGTMVLCVFFTVFVSGSLYFLLLKLLSGEKLKDVINYFQIGIMVLVILSYQVIPRLFDLKNLDIHIGMNPWFFLVPSAWLAAPYGMVFDGVKAPWMVILGLMGALIPLALLFVYLKWITPYFEKNLQKLQETQEIQRGISPLWQRLIHLTGKNPQEKSIMALVLINLERDRNLKLRILPQLVLGFIFPFIFIFNSVITESGPLSERLANSKIYLMMYLMTTFVCGLYTFVTTSENYKGAWLYDYLPVKRRQDIYYGAYKITLMKYILPLYVVTSGIFMLLFGSRIWMDLLIISVNGIFAFLWVSSISSDNLPLSMPFGIIRSNSLARLFASLPFVGLMLILHMLSINQLLQTPVVLAIGLGALALSWLLIPRLILDKRKVKYSEE